MSCAGMEREWRDGEGRMSEIAGKQSLKEEI